MGRTSGRYDYAKLDRALHEKARLGIMTALTARREAGFVELKALCNLTDGNLARHLEVLERIGVVAIAKETIDGRQRTICRLTPEGRRRFASYLGELRRVIRDTGL